MMKAGQFGRREEESAQKTKGEEPRGDRNKEGKKPEGWTEREKDLATGHEWGRSTFELPPPVGLSFLICEPVHLFGMLMVGRRKVGGVNHRSLGLLSFPIILCPSRGSSQSQHGAGQGHPGWGPSALAAHQPGGS